MVSVAKVKRRQTTTNDDKDGAAIMICNNKQRAGVTLWCHRLIYTSVSLGKQRFLLQLQLDSLLNIFWCSLPRSRCSSPFAILNSTLDSSAELYNHILLSCREFFNPIPPFFLLCQLICDFLSNYFYAILRLDSTYRIWFIQRRLLLHYQRHALTYSNCRLLHFWLLPFFFFISFNWTVAFADLHPIPSNFISFSLSKANENQSAILVEPAF